MSLALFYVRQMLKFKYIRPKQAKVIYFLHRSFQHSNNRSNREELELSDNCVKRLKSLNVGESFLRVVVEGGGCSGFQYQFEIDGKTGEGDRVFKRDGVRVIVDTESLDFMRGSLIDYQEELIKSGFVVVDNPQAEQGCSCGASFNVKL